MMRSLDASFSMITRKNPVAGELLQGPDWRWIQQQWKRCKAWFAGQAVARSPSQWVSTPYLHGLDQIDALSLQWIDQHENLVEQVWHRQQGTFRRKRPPDVEMIPCEASKGPPSGVTLARDFCMILAAASGYALPLTAGGLGSEGDKTVLLGPKNWNPISLSKCTVLARHG